MKKLIRSALSIAVIALSFSVVSCGGSGKSKSSSSSSSDDKTENSAKSASEGPTIKMNSSQIYGEDSKYLSYTGEDAKLFVVRHGSLSNGEPGYTIVVKVPVKVNESVNVKSMPTIHLDIVDENGMNINDYKLWLGYAHDSRLAETELIELLKQAPGTTGDLTFYDFNTTYDKGAAEMMVKEYASKGKGVKILDLKFYSKEDVGASESTRDTVEAPDSAQYSFEVFDLIQDSVEVADSIF